MKAIVSAGGTGGHIYPALAIIKKLKEKEKNLDILYIGTHNRMEKEIIPKNFIPYEELMIYGFSKTDMVRNFKNVILLNKAYKKCLKIMKEMKPDIVIGVGGYVTYPVIKAAKKLGIKTIIHEQNSIPGKSNKVLAKYVDKIAVSLPNSLSYFDKSKTILTGNPCSENALDTKEISKISLGLNKNKKLITVVAGSLGSATINDKMIQFLNDCKNKDFEVLYITGKLLYKEFSKNKFSDNIKVIPYLDNLAGILKNTDILITRAGASTISEIIALSIPSILIPSPYVANNHQFYNALELKKTTSGEILEEKNLTSDKLMELIDILSDENTRKLMKKNLKKLYKFNSSEKIYDEIKRLTNDKSIK